MFINAVLRALFWLGHLITLWYCMVLKLGMLSNIAVLEITLANLNGILWRDFGSYGHPSGKFCCCQWESEQEKCCFLLTSFVRYKASKKLPSNWLAWNLIKIRELMLLWILSEKYCKIYQNLKFRHFSVHRCSWSTRAGLNPRSNLTIASYS